MCASVPVLTIDGPSGSGKGTVAQHIAKRLKWHYLDSGALYRVLGWLADQQQVALTDECALISLIDQMEIEFEGGQVRFAGKSLESEIRTESAGGRASKLAALGGVRQALLTWQRQCAKRPGLVADGRDMGTVVFPKADCKIYLTASVEARAQRRFKQLRGKGFAVTIADLLREIAERDRRDINRRVSPLKPAADAVHLDTTGLDVQQVVSKVMQVCVSVSKKGGER